MVSWDDIRDDENGFLKKLNEATYLNGVRIQREAAAFFVAAVGTFQPLAARFLSMA